MDRSAREKIVYHAHKDRESTSTAETYRDERFVALDCLSRRPARKRIRN